MAIETGRITINETAIIELDSSPLTGGGFESPLGSISVDKSTGIFYRKNTVSPTGWENYSTFTDLNLKANLSGGNNFTGDQSIIGSGIFRNASSLIPTFFDVNAGGTSLWSNNVSASDAVQDPSKYQWRLAISQVSDSFSIERSPAGASWSPSTLFSITASLINAAFKRIANVTDPVDPQDASTKNYVDTVSGIDRARENHTGTQSVSTITGLSSVATSGDYNDLINVPVFGTQFSNFLDTVVSTTTSEADPLTAVASAFTTPSVPAGVYRILIQYYWTNTSTTSDSRFALFVDSTVVGSNHNEELKDRTTNRYSEILGYVTFGIAGTHTIQLRFGSEGAITTAVNRVVCEFWRVS